MKTFIYANIPIRFWDNQFETEVKVYQIVKNKPQWLGIVKWKPGSFPGEETAIMRNLAIAKKLPNKFSDGYYNDHTDKKFEILSV